MAALDTILGAEERNPPASDWESVRSIIARPPYSPIPPSQGFCIHTHERMMWLGQSSHMCVSRRVSLQDSVSGAGL